MVRLHRLYTVLFVFLILLISCKQQGSVLQQEVREDPKLTLKSLKILTEDVDIQKMECELKDDVVAEFITAKFDYGDEKDEAIGVVVEGGIFKVDKTKPKIMKISVPAVKGRYMGWEASVKVTQQKQALEVEVGYNDAFQEDGKEEQLPLETIEFIIAAKEDIIKEVIINDGTQDHKPPVKKESEMGGGYWVATLAVSLNTNDFTTYTITAKPKDTNIYTDAVYTYKLKGTKIPSNNAEFIFVNDGNGEAPYVICDIKWKMDCQSQYYEDYGAKSLKMTARTISPRASVFVKAVNPLDDSALTSPEQKLDNDKGIHTGEITLFEDKPTKLIAYVKAEDGATTNDMKGKWQVVFNAVDLFWGYDDSKLSTQELRKTANRAYGDRKF